MAERLTEIDDLTRPDHYYLKPSDRCYYVGEYTPRRGYGFSQTNNIVQNFKKTPDRRGRPEWLELATIVLMPPSRAKDDPLYDNRMIVMLERMSQGLDVDIRELIIQDTSLSASHSSDDRLSPDDLFEHYQLDESLLDPEPRIVGIFDDILTTGAHYRVVKDIICRQYPELDVIGFFFARVVRPEPDFENIFII